MKHKNMLLVSLLMASLVLLGGCQSRTLEPQDPEPTVGESVVEPDPEPVQPVEQEPQIPDNAPGFYRPVRLGAGRGGHRRAHLCAGG